MNKNEGQELITIGDKLPEGVKFSPALPYAFTEHGVTMPASVLKSKKVIHMNIDIVRAFIALNQFALSYKDLAGQIKELKDTSSDHNDQLNHIYNALESLPDIKAEEKKWEDRVRTGFKK